MFNTYPFRNTIGDFKAHFDFIAGQVELPHGVPSAGHGALASGALNTDLELSFNRHGKRRALNWREYRVFGKLVRLFKSHDDAQLFIRGNRVDGNFVVLMGRAVIRYRSRA